MASLSALPLALLVVVRAIGLGLAALGWGFGLLTGFIAFPLLPMLISPVALLLWAASFVLTPTFAWFAVRRFKDMTWNGLVDPVFAGGLGAFCGAMAWAILQRAASLQIA